MKRYRVELSPEALEQAEAIREWWFANRLAAPNLFVDELGAAIAQLKTTPYIGAPYEASELREMRRVLMPRTRYHLYYLVDQGSSTVRIYAIWHGSRGSGPRLR